MGTFLKAMCSTFIWSTSWRPCLTEVDNVTSSQQILRANLRISLPHASDKFHFVSNSIKSPNSSLGNSGLLAVELLISRDSKTDIGPTEINTCFVTQ